MARLRYNGLATGSAGSTVPLTLGASLTNSATSVTFSAALTYNNGTSVPTITGTDYIPLSILDSNGHLSEIVYLTAYTSGATSGTIGRGQEGTSGVAHSSGDKIVQAQTVFEDGDHGSRVKKDATQQTIANGTVTAMTWQNENWDTDGFWTSGASTKFTVPTGLAGKYLVGGCFTFDSATSFDQMVSVSLNGTELVSTRNRMASAFAVPRTSTVLDLAAGDYVELNAYQGSGSNKATTATANSSEFFIQKLA